MLAPNGGKWNKTRHAIAGRRKHTGSDVSNSNKPNERKSARVRRTERTSSATSTEHACILLSLSFARSFPPEIMANNMTKMIVNRQKNKGNARKNARSHALRLVMCNAYRCLRCSCSSRGPFNEHRKHNPNSIIDCALFFLSFIHSVFAGRFRFSFFFARIDYEKEKFRVHNWITRIAFLMLSYECTVCTHSQCTFASWWSRVRTRE